MAQLYYSILANCVPAFAILHIQRGQYVFLFSFAVDLTERRTFDLKAHRIDRTFLTSDAN